MRVRWATRAIALVIAGWAACPDVAAAGTARRIAARGPSALLVGTLFTTLSPVSLVAATASGKSPRLPACRLLHGVEMVAASTILVPAGLLLAPLYPRGVQSAWLDGVVDAFQEDYCTRPVTSVLP